MPVIKRYPNRKLYDTEAKRYITLDGIAELIREGAEVQVVDHTTDEDLTAVTFEKALKQIRQYQWQAHGFGPWLYRIARNEALSRLRRQKWLSPQSWFGATEMRVTETAVQTRQTRQSIHHALARLRPQDRDIIVLRYLEELPSEAVAEILACSTSNVYVRLHRALERLRTELESEQSVDFMNVAPLNE